MSNDATGQKNSISDDQELAKVLAGISDDKNDESAPAEPVVPAGMPTPPGPPPMPPASEPAAAPAKDTTDEAASAPATPPDLPTLDSPAPAPASSGDSGLDAIKQEALGELRPLVDKLQVEADEKFDIYLLMLRSTDDKTLIGPAHDAAKAIQDESKRAQALLDIIKEIDFLSQSKDETAQ